MIQPKKKKCKGTGKAIGYGCNELIFPHRYGLCSDCFKLWLFSNDGLETLQKSIITGKKKAVKEKKSTERKKKSDFNTSAAMSLADTYFSRFIRLQHSEDGYCTCYTCGTIKGIKEVDNGHYQKRTHKTTRYHENNCRPQCKTCNGDTLHNGKQVEFRINLVNEIGITAVEEIEYMAKTSENRNTSFFKEKADYYRAAVNDLQKELGVKYW